MDLLYFSEGRSVVIPVSARLLCGADRNTANQPIFMPAPEELINHDLSYDTLTGVTVTLRPPAWCGSSPA